MKQILLIMLGLSIASYADLTKSGNIVTDSSTELQWQNDAIGSTMTWTAAITHCEGLVLDGQSDWRLPNIKELNSLVDDSRVSPSIDKATFIPQKLLVRQESNGQITDITKDTKL